MPSPQRILYQSSFFFPLWIFLSLLLWGSRHNARADTPTVPSPCSLQKISKDVPYSYATSDDGSLLALASLTSKQKRTRRPWTDPSYTEQFFLLDTRRQKRKKIASHTYKGRGRIPHVAMDASGNKVVFSSAGNPTGENTDGNLEIFLFDVISKIRSQVTRTIDSDNFGPVMNADGTRIAFLTNTNPVGELTDSHTVLTLLDLTTGSATEVARTTAFPSSIWGFSLNGDGTKIALASNLDLTGANADGTIEIFLWDAATQTFTQITNAVQTEIRSGNHFSPVLNDDGTRIVFESTENYVSENDDGSREIFLFDIIADTFTQITHGALNFELGGFAMSADGTRIVFAGDENLLVDPNTPRTVSDSNDSEIFLYNTRTNSLTQLTKSAGESRAPAISADGTQIAFTVVHVSAVLLAGADLNGYNSGTSQGKKSQKTMDPTAGIYLATCP